MRAKLLADFITCMELMHSFPSSGQACFHGKMEPVAGLVITDMGTFLLENMLSAERAARRACVMTKIN